DALVRGFADGPGFWPNLLERARVLDVERPLYYGLRFAERLFGTPVPAESRRVVAGAAPSVPVRAAMDTLVLAAMAPDQPARPRRGKGLARGLLTVRHHWLRMPPLMLARHLVHQALVRRSERG
ncbi:MAG TPA: hypothetical protein VFX14_05170, partial [Methylomirabilota bacterium]|nr:hypothetical protein [Methylomirabilota bacterium]